MKFELKPTSENVIKTIQEDVFERNNKVISFLKLLYSLKENTSICIDGEWGCGKTFFVKQCIKVVETINNETIDLGDLNRKIEENFQSMQNKILPIYYNAWEWDSEEDPLLTIMYEMIKISSIDLNSLNYKSFGEKFNDFVKGIQVQVGITPIPGLELGISTPTIGVNTDDILEKINAAINVKQKFKEILELIIQENAEKVVIFIDELDRCNPRFAIKLIERIKHFLDDDRFVFVFSTNIQELKNTITSAYGMGFNGSYYLQKFFDLVVSLDEIKVESYIRYCGIVDNNQNGVLYLTILDVLKYLNFNIRDCNSYFTALRYVYDYIRDVEYTFHVPTEVLIKDIIYPILLAIRIKKYEDYKTILSGKGRDVFVEYMKQIDTASRYIVSRLKLSETDVEDFWGKIYFYLFEVKGIEVFQLDEIVIDSEIRKKIKDLLGFINEYIKLD